MRTTTATFVGLAVVAAANPLSQSGAQLDIRSPPQANGIQFLCSDYPEVCANMCWGAYCVVSSTTSLVYDKASTSKKRERRKAAGCIDNQKPGNNRCSQGRPGTTKGYNCDEYPFASSKADKGASGGKENRCSRCVPSKENSKQGAELSKGYRDFCKNNTPCNFQVFFGNPGAAKPDHCNPGPDQCKSDSAEKCTGSINIIERRQHEWELTFPDLAKRELYTNGTFVPGPVQFRTYSGQVLDAPYGGFIGQAVHRPRAINQTLHDELIDRHEYDPEGDDDQFNEITSNMVSDIDYIQDVTWEARLKE